MNSFFSRDSFLSSGLRRSSRTRTRKTPRNCPSTSSGKPLHIIPELSEEEHYASESSCPPSPLFNSRMRSRRTPIIVKPTYAEEFTIEDIFSSTKPPRPAPRPPTARPTVIPSWNSDDHSAASSPDSFDTEFALPTPRTLSALFPITPVSKRWGSISPSPSGSSSSPDSPQTPTSSDDESPRFLPRRASIKPLFINKAVPSLKSDNETSESSSELDTAEECDWTEEEEEANAWYSREFSEILTLCSPLPPSFPARPESFSMPASPMAEKAKGRSRMSKPLPALPVFPQPSAQLDPSFPKRKRSIPPMPRRAPPPPPVHIIPHSLPPSRPPPRMSVPDDIGLFDIELDLTPESADLESSFASESSSSVYSQEVDLNMDFSLDTPMHLPLSIPGSPVDLELDIATGLEERALARGELSPMDCESWDGERVLRSRWSSSTLSSIREQDLRSPSSKLRFYFGKNRTKSVSPTTAKKTHSRGVSVDSDFSTRPLRRQGSRSSSSAASDSSGDSTSSSGLRRKPIPIEMFIRC